MWRKSTSQHFDLGAVISSLLKTPPLPVLIVKAIDMSMVQATLVVLTEEGEESFQEWWYYCAKVEVLRSALLITKKSTTKKTLSTVCNIDNKSAYYNDLCRIMLTLKTGVMLMKFSFASQKCILKYSEVEYHYLNCNNISQYYCFFSVFMIK